MLPLPTGREDGAWPWSSTCHPVGSCNPIWRSWSPREEFQECLRGMRWGHRWEMFPFFSTSTPTSCSQCPHSRWVWREPGYASSDPPQPPPRILGMGWSWEHGNPLQYSQLENPMVRGPWLATVHGVAQSWTQLKWLSMHAWTQEQIQQLKSLEWAQRRLEILSKEKHEPERRKNHG